MSNTFNTIIFFIYLIIGIYFINAPFNLIPLPEVNIWFIFAGGILLIFGGIKYLKSSNLFGMGMPMQRGY